MIFKKENGLTELENVILLYLYLRENDLLIIETDCFYEDWWIHDKENGDITEMTFNLTDKEQLVLDYLLRSHSYGHDCSFVFNRERNTAEYDGQELFNSLDKFTDFEKVILLYSLFRDFEVFLTSNSEFKWITLHGPDDDKRTYDLDLTRHEQMTVSLLLKKYQRKQDNDDDIIVFDWNDREEKLIKKKKIK